MSLPEELPVSAYVFLTMLAEHFRDERRTLTPLSLRCKSVADELAFAQNELNRMRQHTPMHRIASVLELTAIHGWGNVTEDMFLQSE